MRGTGGWARLGSAMAVLGAVAAMTAATATPAEASPAAPVRAGAPAGPPVAGVAPAAAPEVELRVRVRGSTGLEHYTVVVDGVAVGDRDAGTAWSTAAFSLAAWPHQVEVRFTNDHYENGVDRNLVVDWVEVVDDVADQRIASSDPSVLNTGAFVIDGCHSGYYGTGELACNGSLFYPVPPAVWQPSAVAARATLGQVQPVAATLAVRRPVVDPTVVVSPGLTGWVTGIRPPGQDLAPGSYRVELAVAPPRGTPAGTVAVGWVTLRSGVTLADTATLAVAVTAQPVLPAASVSEPAVPAPERTAVEAGVTYVTDELVIGIDAANPDSDAVARTVADALDGELIGAVPAGRLYQVRLPRTHDVDGLDSLRAVAAAVPGVATAGLHVFSPVAAVPDDPGWSGWDPPGSAGPPTGNTGHLARIGAPTAWDETTGSGAVGVGVVDGGFDPGHEDLLPNFASLDGARAATGSGHATRVAGTACGVGNNQVGLSGVAWRCALRGYEARVPGTAGYLDQLLVVQGMAQAGLDGVRVANLSFGLAAEVSCAGRAHPAYQVLATSAADQLGQVIAVARAAGRDVLWVKAAGDGGCDSGTDPEAALATRFPSNVLVVASSAPDDSLSSFSDRGDPIRLAAPGEAVPVPTPAGCELFALPCKPGYSTGQGTSLAAAEVTGAAALLFSARPALSAAQTAECLVRGARTSLVTGQRFGVLDVPAALACTATAPLGLPDRLDVVFAVNRSDTLAAPLARLRAEVAGIVETLQALAPGTDVQAAVVSFGDAAGFQDGTACGHVYTGTYGEPDERPFRVDQPLTPDLASLGDALDGITPTASGDRPQAYAGALAELAGPGRAEAIGRRPGAARVTVVLGDSLPHGTDLRAGLGDGPLAPTGDDVPDDTGPDAGPDGQVCTADDVDLHDALDGLRRTGDRLLLLDASGNLGQRQAWARWAARTGGAIALLDADGSGPGDTSLAITVAGLIRLTSGS